MKEAKSQAVGLVALGLLFTLTTLAAGGMVGGLWVRFLMTRAPDGWTGIARGLGGLMVGGAIGLVLALVLLAPLTRRGTRALATATAAAFLLLLVSFSTLYWSNPRRGNSDPVADPPRAVSPEPDRQPTSLPPGGR